MKRIHLSKELKEKLLNINPPFTSSNTYPPSNFGALNIPTTGTKKKIFKRTDELALIKTVTHKFIKKIEPLPNDESLKLLLKNTVAPTRYICLNDEKMPIEYNNPKLVDTLYFCNKCLNVDYSLWGYKDHSKRCNTYTGILAYEETTNKQNIQIYQIDGSAYSRFSHSLTKLGRYFFEEKALDSLLEYFYLFTLIVDGKLVGYFSMDKLFINCNISCIVIFPMYRKYRYSYLLIDFSYKIFQLSGKKASPERPLSTGGEIVFLRYWKFCIFRCLLEMKNEINERKNINQIGVENSETDKNSGENKERGKVLIRKISEETGIAEADIKSTIDRISGKNDNLKRPSTSGSPWRKLLSNMSSLSSSYMKISENSNIVKRSNCPDYLIEKLKKDADIEKVKVLKGGDIKLLIDK
ncbi:Histone acetyltransferase KAT6A [Cucumispora dikerogammari]|nr:Histone acetyltransferase KAT6A [Cucumispora dikerogammari]